MLWALSWEARPQGHVLEPVAEPEVAQLLSSAPQSLKTFLTPVCLFLSRQRDEAGGTEIRPGEAAEDSDEADKGKTRSEPEHPST